MCQKYGRRAFVAAAREAKGSTTMADMMVRPNTNGRGLVSDLFGFDPLRAVFGGGQVGYQGEVTKTDDGWNVEMPVPGFRPEQIDVTVEDRVLTVTGKADRRSFQRSILLPEEVDTDAIEAKVEHGMLTLALRLHPKAQPRKIEVKAIN